MFRYYLVIYYGLCRFATPLKTCPWCYMCQVSSCDGHQAAKCPEERFWSNRIGEVVLLWEVIFVCTNMEWWRGKYLEITTTIEWGNWKGYLSSPIRSNSVSLQDNGKTTTKAKFTQPLHWLKMSIMWSMSSMWQLSSYITLACSIHWSYICA